MSGVRVQLMLIFLVDKGYESARSNSNLFAGQIPDTGENIFVYGSDVSI